MEQQETRAVVPVLIVGGGLGGTAAAAFLARAGVASVVLERHECANERPRAWVVSPRTLELLRGLGIDTEVTRRGTPGAWHVVMTDTLLEAPAGQAPVDPAAGVSPTGSVTCDQDVLEDAMRAYAVEHGAEVRWGCTVSGVVDRGELLEVRLEDGSLLHAHHLVVADGARAGLLEALGIADTVPAGGAPDPAQRFDQVLFRSAELDALMAGVPGNAFVCAAAGVSVFRRDLGRWQVHRQGAAIDDPHEALTAAVGREVAVEVLDHSGWTASAHCAERYRAGRAYLVGDAARSFPPSLGMGGNLAIADAYDLAWKLAWVLAGRAGETLLDSYDEERRPVGTFVMQASLDAMTRERTIDLLTFQLGLGYPAGASSALLGEGGEVTVNDPHDEKPRVGVRLPHRWLPDGRSTLDLATLDTWAAVGVTEVGPDEVPYTCISSLPSEGRPDQVWLVRPDGVVAAHLPASEVGAALDRLLHRPS